MKVKCRVFRPGLPRAFTLPELVIAGALGAMALGGVVYGYVTSARNSEWAAYHFAAHSLAMQRLEQARAAKWDLSSDPVVDTLVSSNFANVVEILDIPITKTNVVYATNVTQITSISTQPPVKMIQVDCSWKFINGRVFTNTVVTYRAKDQ